MSSPFDGLQVPKDLVCELFAVFSRFEFALKESGFVFANRYARATPDWTRYCNQIGASLSPNDNEALGAAIDCLVTDPPQVQLMEHNLVVWRAMPLRGTTEIEKALDSTQRVRNNLFHGGKHTPHSPPGRDEALVRAALVVLNACLEVGGDFKAIYEQTNT